MSRNCRGKFADNLSDYLSDCSILMPFFEGTGNECLVSREKYNAMSFNKRKGHVYKVKENVFGFLNCLAK